MDVSERHARAAAEAAEWALSLESGDLSREQREQFVDWLRESQLHVAEMLRMFELHGALTKFDGWERIGSSSVGSDDNVVPFTGPVANPEPAIEPAAAAKRVVSRRSWIGVGLAASIATLAIGFMVFSNSGVIETGRGERRGVTLEDGSSVQIDPQTRLRIRFEEHTRIVNLESGRALFRVAKDPDRPFLVRAGATVVRAVGTQFGVEQTRDGIVVTVAEGKVAVLPREGAALPFGAASREHTELLDTRNSSEPVSSGAPIPPQRGLAKAQAGAGSAEVFLTANEQVKVPPQGPAEPVRHVDSNRELSWATGRLILDNATVRDVVDQFNHYNVIQMQVLDPQLASRRVSGVFDASEPESFIRFLQSAVPVHVERQEQKITLSLQ